MRALDGAGEALVEARAVGQPGEAVVKGDVLQAAIRPSAGR